MADGAENERAPITDEDIETEKRIARRTMLRLFGGAVAAGTVVLTTKSAKASDGYDSDADCTTDYDGDGDCSSDYDTNGD